MHIYNVETGKVVSNVPLNAWLLELTENTTISHVS